MVRLAGGTFSVGEIVNPYIAGAPVTEQRMFFGREDIFQWIENSITGQYMDHILVIHGQRRVGKTSVLKQLGNRLPSHYIPVFFDLQGRTHTTLDRFLWWLAREIVRVLKQERDIDLPIPEKDDFSKDIEHFENRFLPDLKPVLNGGTLLLTFDEFDNLEESGVKEELARPLIDNLRRLMGRAGLNFIFSIGSSGRKLENMQAEYTDFFKAALYKKISFLSEEQTRHLITRPVEGVLEYERAAVDRIYDLASGHPYFTQLTCHELFARCQRTEQRKISNDDVEAVLDDVVERGTVNLKFVWDEASDIEKWSLAGLACTDKADAHALADFLRKNRVRFSESDLTSGLLHLREKDVLTPDLRFVIQLLKRWLQKNRPVEQVREELTEVNPIANRYIEIGLEFKNVGLYEKAVNSFQEALTISKENIQAQVNIALVYMDRNMHDKAVMEFEKALSMDDEDVSARSGLCEAYLALGDAAMAKGRSKEATQSYLRVLAINTEHTEARQRMADLYRRRAEDALSNGREDEALNAFSEALNYTPEDSTLNDRVKQLQAQKKARQFADLISKSEKEAKAKNWSDVIKSLEEALTLSPEDEVIPKKIEEAKSAQEKVQVLIGIYTEAQKAYTDKNYDVAVSLFKKIVLEDENYRDASRLLAQAIELRRTAPKWWQGKPGANLNASPLPHPAIKQSKIRIWFASGGMVILVLAIIGGLLWYGGDSLIATKQEYTATPAHIPTEKIDPTAPPTATAAYEAAEFSVAYAMAQIGEPYFQTNFDSWGDVEQTTDTNLAGGKLIVSSVNNEHAGTQVSGLQSDRFVVAFDVRILNASPEGHCIYEANSDGDDSVRRALSVMFSSFGTSSMSHWVYQGGHLDIPNASSSIDASKTNSVLVTIIEDQIAIYINGRPAYTARDAVGSAVYTSHSLSANYTAECEFDNFKIWDLSGVDLTNAAQSLPYWLKNETPIYQTGFDSWDLASLPENVKIENGKITETSLNQNGVTVQLTDFSSDKFAVEFELGILESTPPSTCVFEIYNPFATPDKKKAISVELWSDERTIISRYVQQYNGHEPFSIGGFDKSKTNTITLIVLKEQIVVFINKNLAYTVIDPGWNAEYNALNLSAYGSITCEYDNVKLWDLSNMNVNMLMENQ